MKEIILAKQHGDGALLSPQSYLGDRFGDYREAVSRAGARYVPDLRGNVLALDRLGDLAAALADVGMVLAVDPALRTAVAALASQACRATDEGALRLAEANGRLGGDRRLWAYQRDGIRWLAPRKRALLADEMGLGKTVQALLALPADAAVLVVAPAAVAANWIREARVWRPDLRPGKIAGKATWRWPVAGELVIATYGSLPDPDQEVLQPPAGCYVIADEAHALKGSAKSVARVRRWCGVRDAVIDAGGSIWLLTGTPLLNRPQELWRVLEAARLAKDAFGSWPRFVALTGGSNTGYGGSIKFGVSISAEVPLALQRVALRRERATVLPDLPRKVRQTTPVELVDGTALRLCAELIETLERAGASVDALADMATLAHEVRKVVFARLSRVRAALAAAKIPVMLDRVATYEEEEQPLVVFSAHLEPLKTLGAREGWAVISGDVSSDDRAALVERFQAGDLRGLACSFAAGGVGITLTRAHHVLCVDLPWTPALLQQAEDRCCRIGQEADSVHVEILACDHPVDMRVAELLVQKAEIIEATVDAAAVEQTPAVDEVIQRNAEALAEVVTSIADDPEVITAVEKATMERERRMRRLSAEAAEARRRGDFQLETEATGKFRGPTSDTEIHAARAMVALADIDPDRARELNGVGFSSADCEFGHSLASALVKYGQLSDRQWGFAVKLARKYRRQVGDAPR